VENTPVKIIPIKKLSFDFEPSSTVSLTEENEVIEETPIKENDLLPSDIMAREIQRLSLRLRSSTPCKKMFFFLSRNFIDQSFDFSVQCSRS
jgi:hypothetical protein